jgi:septum formation protein
MAPQEQSKLFHRPTPMIQTLLLASASPIRLALLRNAGLDVVAQPARIDEGAIRQSLAAEGAAPREMADVLAEYKARKLADLNPASLVLGCDQVLDFEGKAWSKPEDVEQARAQLKTLRGRSHHLHSALVLYHEGQPIWRSVGSARLTMHQVSDAYLESYLGRVWPAIASSVGGYQIEGEGIRLFSAIEGDYFTILGLPLVPLLSYLALRGFIAS